MVALGGDDEREPEWRDESGVPAVFPLLSSC